MNYDAMNIHVQLFVCLLVCFLINISQSSEIPGLKKCVIDFMRTYQTFLQSACTSVHS